jgi:hypothetical protein
MGQVDLDVARDRPGAVEEQRWWVPPHPSGLEHVLRTGSIASRINVTQWLARELTKLRDEVLSLTSAIVPNGSSIMNI